MIYLKSALQLDCMRKSGALLYEVLCRLKEAIKPGVSTAALDVYAEQLIRKHKAGPASAGPASAISRERQSVLTFCAQPRVRSRASRQPAYIESA